MLQLTEKFMQQDLSFLCKRKEISGRSFEMSKQKGIKKLLFFVVFLVVAVLFLSLCWEKKNRNLQHIYEADRTGK